MMDCKEVGKRLPAYLEGDVSELEAEELRKHFDSCDPCRKVCRDLEKSGYLLRNLTEVETPPWFTQKIMARIEEEAEKKKSWFEKLFFPLHIKIPIEAVASLLIAFLAWQLYQAGEPERAAFQAPLGSLPVITEKYSLQETDKTRAVKPETGINQDILKAPQKKKEEVKIPIGAGRPADKEQEDQVVALSRAPEPPLMGEKKGIPEDRREEKPVAAVPSGRLASPPMAPAPLRAPAASSLDKDRKMADELGTVKPKEKIDQDRVGVREIARLKSRPVAFLFKVSDLGKASQEALEALHQAEARNILRESQEGREIITALVSSQKLPALFETLKKMGGISERDVSPSRPDDLVPIKIEIIRNK